MKRHGRSFNDNPKCAEREVVFCERLCKSDGAPSWVEPVACPVLLRSCFGVDAQQLPATDLDSRVRRSLWISGANVIEEQCPQVLGRKLSFRRPETEQVLLEYRGEFWFLLVLWTSCNVLINTSLRDHSGGIYLCMNVSGDVFDEVVSRSLMSMPAAFLSKLTSVEMSKHLCGVNAFVFFLTCSLEANPSCVPLGEMLDIGALEPAKQPQRESKNDNVDLDSRRRRCVGWTQRSFGQNDVFYYGQDSL